MESDLSSLLQSLRSSMKSGLKCVASNSPCPYPGLARAYVIELIGADDLVTQRVAIDTERKLPAEWAIFNNGKAISMASMKNITVNANIANDMFFINRHADDEKALGSTYNEVLDKLKKELSAAGTLSIEFVRDTKQASNELKHTSELLRHDKLTEQTVDKQESATWLNFGRSILLTRTASMELIAESLKALQPLIQNFEDKHGACAGTAKQWMNSLNSIDRSVSNLYGVLESDIPDSQMIVREADNIKAQTNVLDAVSVRISENLD